MYCNSKTKHKMDPNAPAATFHNNYIVMDDSTLEQPCYQYVPTVNANTSTSNNLAMIPANQLLNRYANRTEDFGELADLLNRWHLGDFYDFFCRKYSN